MIMYGLSREISNMYNKDMDVFSRYIYLHHLLLPLKLVLHLDLIRGIFIYPFLLLILW